MAFPKTAMKTGRSEKNIRMNEKESKINFSLFLSWIDILTSERKSSNFMEPSLPFLLFCSHQKVMDSIGSSASTIFSMKPEFIIPTHRDILLFWSPFSFIIFLILNWSPLSNGMYQISEGRNVKVREKCNAIWANRMPMGLISLWKQDQEGT